MRTSLLLSLVFLVVGCGETRYITKEIPGPEVEVPVPVEQKFEGLYYFEEVASGAVSGPVELIVGYNDEIEAYQPGNQSKLVSQNFNGTFGTHPRISFSDVTAVGDTIYYARDVNYNSSDDLEEDGTTSNLSAGKHWTRYEFYLDSDGLLNLIIYIHEGNSTSSGGINSVVIERHFKEI